MSFQPGLHLFPYADRRSDSVQYCSPLEGRTSTMKIALMMHKYRKMSSTSYSEVPGDSASIDPGHPKPMPPRKTHLEARIERAPVESGGSFFFHSRSNFGSLAMFAANRQRLSTSRKPSCFAQCDRGITRIFRYGQRPESGGIPLPRHTPSRRITRAHELRHQTREPRACGLLGVYFCGAPRRRFGALRRRELALSGLPFVSFGVRNEDTGIVAPSVGLMLARGMQKVR
jgi:hypothetical protein